MKRDGIINAALAAALAGLRHTHVLVVADSGLPVPDGVPVVDLAVVYGLPPFGPVLRAVLGEIVVEGATAATEVAGANPACHDLLRDALPGSDLHLVAHEEFKRLVAGARCVVRTGEATPYANVLLRCGVPFAP